MARPDDPSPPAIIDWLLFAAGLVILLASGMPLLGIIIVGFLLLGVLSGNWFAQAGLLFFVSLLAFSPGTAWRIFFYVFIFRAVVYYFAFSDRNKQPDLDSVEAHQTQALQREETERLAKIDEIGRFTQSVIHIYCPNHDEQPRAAAAAAGAAPGEPCPVAGNRGTDAGS